MTPPQSSRNEPTDRHADSWLPNSIKRGGTLATHLVDVPAHGKRYSVSIQDGPIDPQVSHSWPGLITSHCTDYYGNGNWNGQYWCIGIEPAIHDTDGNRLNIPRIIPQNQGRLLKSIGSVLTTSFLLNDGLTDGRQYQQTFNGNLSVFSGRQDTWRHPSQFIGCESLPPGPLFEVGR